MSNTTMEYEHKEIPDEALASLPDGWCVLGWLDSWMEHRLGCAIADLLLWEDGAWEHKVRRYQFDGATPYGLYAAEQESKIARKCRRGRTMPAREWLKMLPNGYRELALANWDERYIDICHSDNEPVTLAMAVNWAFKWMTTVEGGDFWYNVYYWASVNRAMPPLPGAPDQAGWISCAERLPQEADFDVLGCVFGFTKEGSVWLAEREVGVNTTHWRRTGIEDLPAEPWERDFAKLGELTPKQAYKAGLDAGRKQ